MLLEGKVAIVSGIGPGMGRDISLAFAREGASVALGGRTLSRLEAVAEEVEALGVRALPVVCDVADEASCTEAVNTAAAELGRLDIVVNNAYDGGDAKRFMDADFDRWLAAHDAHVRADTLEEALANLRWLAGARAEYDQPTGRPGRIRAG